MTDLDGESPLRQTILFRWHVVTAVVAGLLIGGWLEALANIGALPWALAMEFGPWVHPLNLLITIFVFVSIPLIEVLKRIQSDLIDRLRITQLGIWWSFWILLGLACRFGTWQGP